MALLYVAAQHTEKHFAQEYEKSETFCLYPSNSQKNFLRKIEMIGDEHSKVLKRSIDDNFTALNNQFQNKFDKLYTISQHDVTKMLEKHPQQSEQFYED